jgi:very-short-patch-repair endonuclease
MRSMVEGQFPNQGLRMFKDPAPKPKLGAVGRARSLRRQMTLPELLLWQELRKRPGGLKFRRQHPSGPYILDFFCADARLAVEIDGETHQNRERAKHDAERDAWFTQSDVLTLRISARDVLNNLEPVLSYIVREAKARLPLHRPAGGPPPRDKLGEE